VTPPAGSATLILIPARLAATRLPRKPLAMIGDAPMIVHVLRRAQEAGLGPVAVAVDSAEIADVVIKAGGQAVMTDPDLPSGSDRIAAALTQIDPDGRYGIIVNLQGDFPTLSGAAIRAVVEPLADPAVDIATLAFAITEDHERANPNVVKLVGSPLAPRRLRALYFTRATAPSGDGPLYHHLGVYAYRRAALQRFMSLPPSPLEQRERLEQLRALEAGLRIDAMLIDEQPFGVDSPADLERARAILATH
jgi:3-deoxy-manno-octulosonate cytidylyltransferase (CMP-KDO synthetase)